MDVLGHVVRKRRSDCVGKRLGLLDSLMNVFDLAMSAFSRIQDLFYLGSSGLSVGKSDGFVTLRGLDS